MKIIGLGHYSRTGKDTFANALVQDITDRSRGNTRIKKIPFAWKLKQICHDLYAWDGLREPEFYDTSEGEKFRDIKLPIKSYGYSGCVFEFESEAEPDVILSPEGDE